MEEHMVQDTYSQLTYLETYHTRTITLTHLIIAAYVARVTLLPACKYRLTMLPYILALVLS